MEAYRTIIKDGIGGREVVKDRGVGQTHTGDGSSAPKI